MVLAIKLKSKESECVALCLRKREWARQFKLKQLPLSPSPSPSLSSHNAKPKLNVQTGKSSNSSSSRSRSRGRGTASHKWEYIYLFELSLDSESAKCGRSQSRRAVSSSRSASEIRTSNWRRFSLFVFPPKGKTTTTTRKLTQKDAANSCPDDILSAKELPRVPSHYSYKWNNTHTRANIIYTHTHSLRQGKEWKFWESETVSERERERGVKQKACGKAKFVFEALQNKIHAGSERARRVRTEVIRIYMQILYIHIFNVIRNKANANTRKYCKAKYYRI